MSGAFCPDCDKEITFNPHPRLGQKLTCPQCDVELEVISVDPPELDWAYDWSEEDWEDEED
jgi:alpha-aminoadipate carrier protein LysW